MAGAVRNLVSPIVRGVGCVGPELGSSVHRHHHQDLDSFPLSLFIRSQDGCNSSGYYTLTRRSRGRKDGGESFPKAPQQTFPQVSLAGNANHVTMYTNRRPGRKATITGLEQSSFVLALREECFWKEATNSTCYRV